LLATALLVIEKLALVVPAGTVTLPGALATVESLWASATTAPPDGAGALSDTTPEDDVPPLTLVGFNASEASTGRRGFLLVVWTLSKAAAVTSNQISPAAIEQIAKLRKRLHLTVFLQCKIDRLLGEEHT
jgi:hypothetical protein